MTATRARGTLELARVRRRRRRVVALPTGNGVPYLLAKLLDELRYGLHACRSCGHDMEQTAPGFWWCENCADFGAARRRRQHVGSKIGRPS